MGLWDTIKKAVDVVKKTVQTVVPGGSKGYLEPKAPAPTPTPSPAPRGGTPAQMAQAVTAAATPKVVSSNRPRGEIIPGTTGDPNVDRGMINTILKTDSGKFRTDIAGIFEQQTGAKVLMGTVPLGGVPTSGILMTNAAGQISKIGKTAGVVQKNSKISGLIKSASEKIIGSTTWKGLATATLGLVVVDKILEKTLGGKNFGEFVGMEEAIQAISYPTTLAYQAGDWESYDLGKEARDELLADDSLWDTIKSYIPFLNLGTKLDDYREAAIVGGTIMDKLAEDKRIKEDTNETDADMWERIRQQQRDDDKAAVDYYNEEREKLLKWEEEAKDRDMREDAAFWAKEAAKQRELERLDREAIALFWLEYRKLQQKLEADNRPSNLNFGLL